MLLAGVKDVLLVGDVLSRLGLEEHRVDPCQVPMPMGAAVQRVNGLLDQHPVQSLCVIELFFVVSLFFFS